MDMYFTSGKISHDEFPWYCFRDDIRWRFQRFPEDKYLPRPEFDNHNPILVEFRRSAPWDVVRSARIAAEWLEAPARPIPANASSEQIEHARRVLTKLSKLS